MSDTKKTRGETNNNLLILSMGVGEVSKTIMNHYQVGNKDIKAYTIVANRQENLISFKGKMVLSHKKGTREKKTVSKIEAK